MAQPPEDVTGHSSPARWVERWWAGQAGWPGRLLDLALAPAEFLFRGAVRGRGTAYDHGILASTRVSAPVVSVGNISVGGAGKTPVTRWLVAELRRRGATPAVLHGGYAVDEPTLHRLWHPEVPVMVGRDRIVTARRAIETGATVLVLDDGYQHRRLARDLDLALVAAESWTARPRLLPRGPWREPPAALGRAQAVVVTRKTAAAEMARSVLAALRPYAPGAAAIQLRLRPAGWSRGGVAAEPGSRPPGVVLAVTAIAHPELFVLNAREAGAEVGPTLFFPDHHDYGEVDLERIRKVAAGRPVVTTSKDLVKLGPIASDLDLWVLEQEVIVEEGADALHELLDRISGRTRAPTP